MTKSGIGIEVETVWTAGSITQILAPILMMVADDRFRMFRSDELVDAVLRTPGDVVLGSVDDIVMSPKTGKIAYLVIARGGIFGIDEKYVPVPWDVFRVVPNMDLFVLDTTKDAMDAAPQVNRNQFAPSGHFDQESQKVDDYWKAHLARNGNN
jgi:sporulation protein YlmC with PRC-barrel domain